MQTRTRGHRGEGLGAGALPPPCIWPSGFPPVSEALPRPVWLGVPCEDSWPRGAQEALEGLPLSQDTEEETNGPQQRQLEG